MALMFPLVMPSLTYAADVNVTSIETFIKSIVNISASLAGLVTAAFFVWGGFGYITSSSNIDRLDRSKRTLLHAGLGLMIDIAIIAAGQLSSIVALSTRGLS